MKWLFGTARLAAGGSKATPSIGRQIAGDLGSKAATLGIAGTAATAGAMYGWGVVKEWAGTTVGKIVMATAGAAVVYNAYQTLKDENKSWLKKAVSTALSAGALVMGVGLYRSFNTNASVVSPDNPNQNLGLWTGASSTATAAVKKIRVPADISTAPSLDTPKSTLPSSPDVKNSFKGFPLEAVDSSPTRLVAPAEDILPSVSAQKAIPTPNVLSELPESGRPQQFDNAAKRSPVTIPDAEVKLSPQGAQKLETVADNTSDAFKAATATAAVIPKSVNPDATIADDLSNGLTGKTSAEIGEHLGELKALSKGRLGGNLPLIGAGIAVTLGGAMTYQFITQRKYIEAAYAESIEAGAPIMSEDAFNAYLDMSVKNQVVLSSDLGLSTADPFGVTLPISAAAEMSVYSSYKDWMDTHAPNLDTAMVENLSMSLMTPDSVRTDVADEMRSALRGVTDTAAYDPAFKDIIEAQAQLNDAVMTVRNKPNGGFVLGGFSGLSSEDLIETKQLYIDANAPESEIAPIETALQETQAIDAGHEARNEAYERFFAENESTNLALGIIKPGAKMDLIDRLAKSEIPDGEHDMQIEANISALAVRHPKVAAYLKQTHNSWFKNIGSADNILRNDPSAMDAYLLDRLENPAKPNAPVQEISPEAPVVEGDALISEATQPAAPVTQAGIDVIEAAKEVAEKTPTAEKFSEAVNASPKDVEIATAATDKLFKRVKGATSVPSITAI